MPSPNNAQAAVPTPTLGLWFTGGIRLDPSSAALWAGLGTCAKQAHQQEYAFTRSLQLDPKSAHTWAALGRLYMESGARSLADTCFTQARSQEPADSATWAAMGALAGLSPTGGRATRGVVGTQGWEGRRVWGVVSHRSGAG